ncbi:hypothetical protein WICPIJ_004451 [Wickerhamomyces pijperi]|uniref:Uncharacterized protein n=1 Tax=Wickerhamomyces pijperi TaxID=599730 RepID=A0A9P8TN91_WICPI|nr:hypothetical protein WICPIJ_004451 [Wickerhamomyces pijperi]
MWLAQILKILSLLINNLTLPVSLCFKNLTSPVPLSFHSLFSGSNLNNLARTLCKVSSSSSSDLISTFSVNSMTGVKWTSGDSGASSSSAADSSFFSSLVSSSSSLTSFFLVEAPPNMAKTLAVGGFGVSSLADSTGVTGLASSDIVMGSLGNTQLELENKMPDLRILMALGVYAFVFLNFFLQEESSQISRKNCNLSATMVTAEFNSEFYGLVR